MPPADRHEELARLVEEQARDDRTKRLPRGRALRECELGTAERPGSIDSVGGWQATGKFRGRSRAAYVRDDSGTWQETRSSGRRASFWTFLIGSTPWEGSIEALVRSGRVACPVCGDGPIKHLHYCTYCDRTGIDGKLELFGVEPDTVLNNAYIKKSNMNVTKHKAGKLKGGIR